MIQLGSNGIERVGYEDTEHFEVTRSFLNRSEAFLDILMADDD